MDTLKAIEARTIAAIVTECEGLRASLADARAERDEWRRRATSTGVVRDELAAALELSRADCLRARDAARVATDNSREARKEADELREAYRVLKARALGAMYGSGPHNLPRRPGMNPPNIGPGATVEARLDRIERVLSRMQHPGMRYSK